MLEAETLGEALREALGEALGEAVEVANTLESAAGAVLENDNVPVVEAGWDTPWEVAVF